MVRIHANSAAKPFKPDPRCRDQNSYYSLTTRLTHRYLHRNMNALDRAWKVVEMNPEPKEAAQDASSGAQTTKRALELRAEGGRLPRVNSLKIPQTKDDADRMVRLGEVMLFLGLEGARLSREDRGAMAAVLAAVLARMKAKPGLSPTVPVTNGHTEGEWWEHGEESDLPRPEHEVRGIVIRDIAGHEEETEPEKEKKIPKAALVNGDNKVNCH